MRFEVTLAAALALAGGMASAAAAQNVSSVDQKGIKRIVVYGTDPCPPSASGDIVVCARRPDDDRYRIPERFREPDELTGDLEAWAFRAERLEMHGAGGIQSCSPVGPGGATGCMQQLINSSVREREGIETREERVP
jgi:hypothetical protein